MTERHSQIHMIKKKATTCGAKKNMKIFLKHGRNGVIIICANKLCKHTSSSQNVWDNGLLWQYPANLS